MFETVTLSSVCTIVKQTPPQFDGYKQYVATADLQKSEIISSTKVTYENRPSRADSTVRFGDVLFAKMAGTEKTLIAKREHQDMLFSTGFAILRPIPEILDSAYLYHILRSEKFLLQKDRMSSGATQKAITNKALLKIKIPIPPISEQKRIAAMLDKGHEIMQSSKQFSDAKNDLFRSLFIEMFGDPIINEMNWEINPVIDYCTCIVPGRDKPKSFTGNTPWVTTADLNHLGTTLYSRDSIGLTDSEIQQVRARVIPKSSVILTCVGDLGVVSIAGMDMVVNQQLHTFQCSDKINNIFLMHSIAFQTPYMHKMASSTTVPYMNKTIANNIPTIFPPLELQEKFANIILDLSKLFDVVSQKNYSCMDLSKSLEQSIFQ